MTPVIIDTPPAGSEYARARASGMRGNHIFTTTPTWCKVVHIDHNKAFTMPFDMTTVSSTAKSTRTSVTFPTDLYETLEAIAKEKKVTVAWVIRDAAEKYADEQWPLFGREAA